MQPVSLIDSDPASITGPKGKPRSGDAQGSATSLMRALAILELTAQRSGGLTNAEISRRLKMATSTTSYILSRLERKGYLVRTSPRGRYEIGLKVIALAHGALREMGLRRAAEPVLHRLAAETRHSALIGVLERGFVMIVEKVEQPDLTWIDMDIGVRYPAHTTALGKVLLAHLPQAELAGLFQRIRIAAGARLAARAAQTQFLQELKTVRAQGHGTSVGELFLGVRAIAAPIFDSAGNIRAAVSATSKAGKKTMDDIAITACVKRAAKQISMRLGEAEGQKVPRGDPSLSRRG